MTYAGSSCPYIYNKYPEIYKNNPKEKSGYYHLNNNQWTYCNMTVIAAKDVDFIYNCATVEVIKSTYQSFLPGQSCKSIYNNNAESREWSGYYWITSDRVYCGMNYTGSSCEGIVLVWEEDGEELLILTSVQEMIVRVSGGRPHTLMLASVEWPVMVGSHVLLPISLLME